MKEKIFSSILKQMNQNYLVKVDYRKSLDWYHPKSGRNVQTLLDSCVRDVSSSTRKKGYVYLLFDQIDEVSHFVRKAKALFPRLKYTVVGTAFFWKR